MIHHLHHRRSLVREFVRSAGAAAWRVRLGLVFAVANAAAGQTFTGDSRPISPSRQLTISRSFAFRQTSAQVIEPLDAWRFIGVSVPVPVNSPLPPSPARLTLTGPATLSLDVASGPAASNAYSYSSQSTAPADHDALRRSLPNGSYILKIDPGVLAETSVSVTSPESPVPVRILNFDALQN